nr:LytR C-terminal domain-containing protein [uncultured Anaerobutyricum sp.]
MKKPSLIKRFFSFLLRLCVVLILMTAIAVGSFEGVTYYLTGSFTSVKKAVKEETDQSESGEDITDTTVADNKNMENTLVFVHDDNTGKDYTTLNMYDKETKALDILLMPCDAQVSVSNTLLKELRKTMSDANSTISLSEVGRAFGDKKYEMFVKIMEDISGISISGYDVISSQNFKKLLNVAGNVTYHFNNAISYRDEQNTLQTIDAGDISLDSEKAYALLTYMDGTDDEESRRLERANTYFTSYVEALLSKENDTAIAKKYDSLVTEEKKDTTSTEDILKSLTTDAVTIRIMQGSETKGIFTLDSQKVKLQVAALAKQAEAYKATGDSSSGTGSSSASTTATDTTESSKQYSIEIYNAAYVSGLAREWETYLEGEGYSISLVDSYQEEGPISQTRINVTEEGMGEDLLNYFPDADINVVDSISTGGDIQIYIGTDSTDVPQSSGDSTTVSDEDVVDDGSDSADDSNTSSEYDFSQGE